MTPSRLVLIASALLAAISVGMAVGRKPQPVTAAPSAADQDAMIAAMVGNLAQRLRDNPKNVQGWIMLMRSYAALGRGDEANAAYARAKAANPESARTIDAAAVEMGVGAR